MLLPSFLLLITSSAALVASVYYSFIKLIPLDPSQHAYIRTRYYDDDSYDDFYTQYMGDQNFESVTLTSQEDAIQDNKPRLVRPIQLPKTEAPAVRIVASPAVKKRSTSLATQSWRRFTGRISSAFSTGRWEQIRNYVASAFGRRSGTENVSSYHNRRRLLGVTEVTLLSTTYAKIGDLRSINLKTNDTEQGETSF